MKKSTKILIILAIIIAIITITAYVVVSNINKQLGELTNIELKNIDMSTIEDGVYYGSYDVTAVSVEVKVTVSNHTITKIDILKHINGQGSSAESIKEDVINAQSLQVDAISGATYSSKVILLAIENALLGD